MIINGKLAPGQKILFQGKNWLRKWASGQGHRFGCRFAHARKPKNLHLNPKTKQEFKVKTIDNKEILRKSLMQDSIGDPQLPVIFILAKNLYHPPPPNSAKSSAGFFFEPYAQSRRRGIRKFIKKNRHPIF